MRNPWGVEVWNGDWSDNSSLWTDQLRQELEWHDKRDDGIFYLSVEDLYDRYETTFINYDTSSWTLGYFAMFYETAE